MREYFLSIVSILAEEVPHHNRFSLLEAVPPPEINIDLRLDKQPELHQYHKFDARTWGQHMKTTFGTTKSPVRVIVTPWENKPVLTTVEVERGKVVVKVSLDQSAVEVAKANGVIADRTNDWSQTNDPSNPFLVVEISLRDIGVIELAFINYFTGLTPRELLHLTGITVEHMMYHHFLK